MNHTLPILLFVLFGAMAISAQQSTDPGHKGFAEVSGIRFSVPNGVQVENTKDAAALILKGDDKRFIEFVAAPGSGADSKYITDLAAAVVAQMLPQEKKLKWKFAPEVLMIKSGFQTSSGSIKAIGERAAFVQVLYSVVRANGRDVLVGYAMPLTDGTKTEAKFLFESNESSLMYMPAYYSMAHIIASVTGEKYEQVNSGTGLIIPAAQ